MIEALESVDHGSYNHLLHNMSVPPKTVVRYEGLSDLLRNQGFGGSGGGSIKYRNPAIHGTRLRVELPEAFPVGSAEEILAALGCEPVEDPESVLAGMIEARAATARLPDGCLVSTRSEGGRMLTGTPLGALAILTKCSERVWLRSKTPNLAALQNRRAVTLLVPPTYVDTPAAEPQP